MPRVLEMRKKEPREKLFSRGGPGRRAACRLARGRCREHTAPRVAFSALTACIISCCQPHYIRPAALLCAPKILSKPRRYGILICVFVVRSVKALTHIYLDAMGGDNAPACTVAGAVEALRADAGLKVTLAGDEQAITPLLTDCLSALPTQDWSGTTGVLRPIVVLTSA